ncbi:GNAT family N-acetyltransferase [Streptomyces zingiberis]|uniref:GNAT family N-acetyltransferase n=1 Tax=Streptomyces zingiberis TaxID=2053010 RepID=A0ABX1BQB5_9ACTN|nr:GNAT family N-acetyltransferase [Streptomyces zingiberis]NJP99880.1 GNAT family N-acetyltransferase [Streptomyces zingiberis]
MVDLRSLSTEDDWPLWRDARLAALAEAPHAFKSRLADWHSGDEERWRARLTAPGTYNLVALLGDGRIAGVASGVPAGPGGVYALRSVWVSPEARGKGVADRLLTAVGTWARQAGATALRLTVMPDNEPAIALYRRHGFARTDEPGDLLADGVTRDLVMRKPLD